MTVISNHYVNDFDYVNKIEFPSKVRIYKKHSHIHREFSKNDVFILFTLILFLDKQQEVDINNLRLSEEDGSGGRPKGVVGGGAGGRAKVAPPLSQISGVKKPLGHTTSFSGTTLPEYGVETKHPEQLAKVDN